MYNRTANPACCVCDLPCDNSWTACRRSLYSQTGLGGLVAEYTILLLVSGIAPRKYIDRHIIKPKKIVTLDLNVKEVSALMRYIL